MAFLRYGMALSAATVSFLVTLAPFAFGQKADSARLRSHGAIPGGGMVDQAQLQDRLRQARLASDFQDLVKRTSTDPRFLQEIQNDPARRKQIEDLLESVLKSQPSGSFLNPDGPGAKQLEGLIRDLGGKNGAPPAGFNPELWKQIEEVRKPKPAPAAPTATPPSSATPRAAAPPLEHPRPPTAESKQRGSDLFAEPPRGAFEDRLMRWTQQMMERNPALRDSNMMRRLIDEFDRMRLQESLQQSAASLLGTTLVENMEKLIPSRVFVDDKIGPLLNQVPRLNLPQLQLPRIELPQVSLPSMDVAAPSVQAPSLGALVGSAIAIGGVMALVVVGLRIHRLRGESPSIIGSAGHKRPAIAFDVRTPIRTRQDLIRAFEHLSLREIGIQAESLNHRAIAEQLGGYSPPRRRAAANLARSYETARYAPEVDALSPADLCEAQREFNLLAEAGHA